MDKDDPYAEIPVKDFSYSSNQDLPKKKKPKLLSKTTLMISLIVVILAAIAVAVILLLPSNKPPKKTTKPSTATSSTSSFLSFNPSTNYVSSNFNLSVNYPKSWKLNDQTSALTITSPVTTLTNDQGKDVSSKILVSVFNQGQIPSAFGTSGSVAVLNSVIVPYSNPAGDQAAQTYVSFVQYPSTTVLGGLDAIYVTGNDGYQKDQTIPNSDITGIDPLVIFSFLGCNDSACTTTSPLTISSTVWSKTAFSTLITDIIKSFVFD